DDTTAIFESKSALPKAFAVTSWEGAASEDAARQYVVKNIESLTDIPPIIEGIEGRHGAPGNTPVEITDFGSNRVEIKSTLNSPHIIVLTDNFANGWTAYVDNKKTAIFRANATVRSVYVPEGGHTIVFIYRPWAFVLPLVPAALAFLYISFLFINKGKSAEV
ncbi:MAG: YfhO family protein, partial [Deltaproteobacteria bacterium]|nr:YfhO family protein [Deltaproteobacteria bacterium]